MYVCLAVMLTLLAGSIFFWRERMLFYDAAFISFRIINLGKLQIMEHRYGSFITQMVPLLGAALHLSLKAILIAYSASFQVFYLLVFLMLCRWRVFSLAILLTFYLTLFVSDTFFWTNNEVHQGTAWLLLWLGYVLHANEHKTKPLPVLLISLLLLPLAVFTHPLIIFSAVFLWGFFWLEKRLANLPSWLLLAITAVLILTVFFKQQLSRNGWYDADKIASITQADTKSILAAFSNEMSRLFLENLFLNYWVFPVLLAWGIFMLLKQGKVPATLWLLGSLAVLYILICLSFPNWLSFHAESEWMTFSLIGVTPFAVYGLQRLKPLRAAWLLGGIFLIRFAYIGMATPAFVARQEKVFRLTAAMQDKGLYKAALTNGNTILSWGTLAPWGLPVETLYAAALKGYQPQPTLIAVDSAGRERVLQLAPKEMAGPWDAIKSSDLNKNYFQTDTTQVYQIMNLQQLLPR